MARSGANRGTMVVAKRKAKGGLERPVSHPEHGNTPTIGSRLIKARAESLTEKPRFRSAFARRRCFIPADCFFEWNHQGTTKQKATIIATLSLLTYSQP